MAQSPGPVPIGSNGIPGTGGTPSVPSIENMTAQAANSSKNNAPKPLGRMELPAAQGQHWVEYDIRPYTQNLKNVERPQQIILDWILRETGTDV